jgi:hypothetical protein
MIVIRFAVPSQPCRAEEIMAALQGVDPPSRALVGGNSIDMGRDGSDTDMFTAVEVHLDRVAPNSCSPTSRSP